MIYIACDHGGLELKKAILDRLREKCLNAADLGTDSTASCDYPDFGIAVAERVAGESGAKGIVICKTGNGMAMSANKVRGIRCALCTSVEMGRLARAHNDANVLSLGAGNTDINTALEIVDAFIETEFEGGRHSNRVGKIVSYENRR